MLEEDIELLIMCLKEYIKDVDGEEFKKIFLGYVEITIKIVLLMNMIK